MATNDLPLASQSSRIVHSLVDTLVVIILWILISAGIALILYQQKWVSLEDERVIIASSFLLSLIYFFYFLILEFQYQRTVGKLITKSKVVMRDGSKPALSKIALRTCCRLIPFEYLSFIFTQNGIHDTLSGTRVVKWYA